MRLSAVLTKSPQMLPSLLEKAMVLPKANDLAEQLRDDQPVLAEHAVVGNEEKTPVLALSVDDYLPPSRLDRVPRALTAVDVNVGLRGIRGVVGDAEIVLLISSSGDVDEILLLGSTLPSFVVEEAVERFRQVKFEPGMVGRWTVRSRLRIRLVPPNNDELLGNPHSAREKAWR